MHAASIEPAAPAHVTLEQALRAAPGRWTINASADEQGRIVVDLHPVGHAARKVTRLVLGDVLVDPARPAVAEELELNP